VYALLFFAFDKNKINIRIMGIIDDDVVSRLLVSTVISSNCFKIGLFFYQENSYKKLM